MHSLIHKIQKDDAKMADIVKKNLNLIRVEPNFIFFIKINRTLYMGVFGDTDYESIHIILQNGGSNLADKIAKFLTK